MDHADVNTGGVGDPATPLNMAVKEKCTEIVGMLCNQVIAITLILMQQLMPDKIQHYILQLKMMI